jgi:catechol 2,3-dioxygenase
MAIKELGHIVLYVRDLQRSRVFYRDVLGFQEIFAMPPHAAGFSSGRTHHELLLFAVGPDAQPIPKGRRIGLYHFGLKVGDGDDELREVLGRLGEAGIPLVGMSDHVVTHSLYVSDPDGNEVELYVDVPGIDWRGDPSILMQGPRPLRL